MTGKWNTVQINLVSRIQILYSHKLEIEVWSSNFKEQGSSESNRKRKHMPMATLKVIERESICQKRNCHGKNGSAWTEGNYFEMVGKIK